MAARREDGPKLRVVEAAALSDSELVDRFRDGSRAAFNLLVERHQALVLAVVRRFARSSDDARELAQRAFVRAFEVLDRGLKLRRAHEAEFRAWVVRIALNLAKNHARDERSRRLERIDLAASVADGAASPDVRLSQAQQQRAMREAVLALPRRQREVLTLRIDGALPFKEIAAVLSTTENNAKVLFHHALKRLKAAVREEESDGV